MSEQLARMHQAWRTAWKNRDCAKPLVLEFGSPARAKSMRFAFYKSVRDIKTGKIAADEELLLAVRGLTLLIDGNCLVFSHGGMPDLMEALDKALGTSRQSTQTGEERAVAEAAQRVMARLGQEAPPPDTAAPEATPVQPGTRVTPYYTR